MNIDFIKWMCDKAEGFRLQHSKKMMSKCLSLIMDGVWTSDIEIGSRIYNHLYYPLLLQRAIEGVNRENTKGFKIIQNDHDIIVMDYITNEVFEIIRVSYTQTDFRFDQAKESALMYIYEQEEQNV